MQEALIRSYKEECPDRQKKLKVRANETDQWRPSNGNVSEKVGEAEARLSAMHKTMDYIVQTHKENRCVASEREVEKERL